MSSGIKILNKIWSFQETFCYWLKPPCDVYIKWWKLSKKLSLLRLRPLFNQKPEDISAFYLRKRGRTSLENSSRQHTYLYYLMANHSLSHLNHDATPLPPLKKIFAKQDSRKCPVPSQCKRYWLLTGVVYYLTTLSFSIITTPVWNFAGHLLGPSCCNLVLANGVLETLLLTQPLLLSCFSTKIVSNTPTFVLYINVWHSKS